MRCPISIEVHQKKPCDLGWASLPVNSCAYLLSQIREFFFSKKRRRSEIQRKNAWGETLSWPRSTVEWQAIQIKTRTWTVFFSLQHFGFSCCIDWIWHSVRRAWLEWKESNKRKKYLSKSERERILHRKHFSQHRKLCCSLVLKSNKRYNNTKSTHHKPKRMSQASLWAEKMLNNFRFLNIYQLSNS